MTQKLVKIIGIYLIDAFPMANSVTNDNFSTSTWLIFEHCLNDPSVTWELPCIAIYSFFHLTHEDICFYSVNNWIISTECDEAHILAFCARKFKFSDMAASCFTALFAEYDQIDRLIAYYNNINLLITMFFTVYIKKYDLFRCQVMDVIIGRAWWLSRPC